MYESRSNYQQVIRTVDTGFLNLIDWQVKMYLTGSRIYVLGDQVVNAFLRRNAKRKKKQSYNGYDFPYG
jgi:hypothetical protein